jgi:hypothetical protein
MSSAMRPNRGVAMVNRGSRDPFQRRCPRLSATCRSIICRRRVTLLGDMRRAGGIRMGSLRYAALFALLAGLSGCGETVVIPWQPVPGARQPVKPLTGILSLPDGKGPFPAIVILHGCDGIRARETGWASRLNHWGYAALIVDSAGLPAGSPFEMHTYPGAGHDFDDGATPSSQFKGQIVGYDAAAAAQAFVVTKGFLDRYVGSPAN